MTTFTGGPDVQPVADPAAWQAAPQCTFYIRTTITTDPATYRYDQAYVRGDAYGNGGSLVTPHPPAVSDLIWLNDGEGHHPGGNYRVIERAWQHAAYGSANWPLGTKRTTVGPILTIILEADAGPFRDEAPGSEED
jgi:hypothetical protein